jgi:hypothetical protein
MVVRSSPPSFRLSFALPRDWCLSYDGPQPLAHGCFLTVQHYLVAVEGRSREAVFEDAATLFRSVLAMAPGALSIAATLETPHGKDTWSIILKADVAFSPTSLDPHFPRAASA